MLDLFTIFSKGGIVLWYFQGTTQFFPPSVNALIRSVILQERIGTAGFEHSGLTLKCKLDNEFDLIFVVAYQKILQLSYIDKFLDDVHLEFRDKYKDDLTEKFFYKKFDFQSEFSTILKSCEDWCKNLEQVPRRMRSYGESEKSKKKVSSMIERKGGDEKEIKKSAKKKTKPVEINVSCNGSMKDSGVTEEVKNDDTQDEMAVIEMNKQKLLMKMKKGGTPKAKSKDPKSPTGKKSKEMRKWNLEGSGKEAQALDYSKPNDGSPVLNAANTEKYSSAVIGQMKGGLKGIEIDEDSEDDFEDDSEEEIAVENKRSSKPSKGVFQMFKGLVGNKTITQDSMKGVLEKLKDHMIGKNVASEIAEKLCDSVAEKLEGKILGTFEGIASTVKATLTESLVQLLSPKRRIDILRDIMESQKQNRPHVVAFCGVNGVGKSTNLAKICFWLIENNFRVLIAACDTFRAGAVEQLRTHVHHLNSLHPPEEHYGRQMVQLYEKGYGKDAAGIAMEAINYARDVKIDVVLVDTAGRMQDNEPLMRALAKLIKVNDPDLVLFVGEALVGNEAVDQLLKFNQALADHSSKDNPHLIDGIVLTKFDTIDDKVGAAISMTYITGQPILFVGTGQTYTDLKNLNAKAVVQALMK